MQPVAVGYLIFCRPTSRRCPSDVHLQPRRFDIAFATRRERRSEKKPVAEPKCRNAVISTPMVPMEGVEPTRPCGQRILSASRLPFRHIGFGAVIALTFFSANEKQKVRCQLAPFRLPGASLAGAANRL